MALNWTFLSTPSARRATFTDYSYIVSSSSRFLSTPSARRATVAVGLYTLVVEISIHALREEGDGVKLTVIFTLSNFYPRPPRGGRP